jgi:N-acetylneuraminic acid mutarotase
VFGTYQTPGDENTPGALQNSVIWTDKEGNFWLFSGVEYSAVDGKANMIMPNTLWEFNLSNNEWAWMGGSNSLNGNTPGVYGTLGQPAAGNAPGGRTGAVSWTDSSGKFWLFGGGGLDSAGNTGSLNDLWMFDPSILQWTWMGGSNLLPATGSAPGAYGTLQVPAAGNIPYGRDGAFKWTDNNGNIWIFGGSSKIAYNIGGSSGIEGAVLNDLWEFNSTTHEWAWMAGSNTFTGNAPGYGNYPGVYGTLGSPSAGNTPGGRSPGYTWTDSNNNLWLFGGNGFDSTDTTGNLNDTWKFDPSINEWAWMDGSSKFLSCITGSITCSVPGVYGTEGAGNSPGARDGAVQWADKSGNIWLFGGWGVDSTGTWGMLNDLWEFTPSTSPWTWMGGSNRVPDDGSNSEGQLGVYGTLGVQFSTNMPGGRQAAAFWTDSNGNIWTFGGSGCNDSLCSAWLNDLWEYSAAIPAFFVFSNPSSAWVATSGSGSSEISVSVQGGFSSAVVLSASGQPDGVTVSFSPSSIIGAGTSTMTITVGGGVAYGTYPITVTGTSGSLSQTASVALTVTRSTPVATPIISPATGSYIAAQSVTMSDITPGATIYYTTDDMTPTTSSTVYTGPITVSSSEVIKAIAVDNTYPNSAMTAAVYTINPALATPGLHGAYSAATNGDPISVQIADLNGDGLPDIIYETEASSTTTSAMKILFAQPGGGCMPGPALVLPAYVGGCRTLDANKDGKVDLACLYWIDTFDMSIATFLGNGDGTFQTPIYSPPMQSCVNCDNGNGNDEKKRGLKDKAAGHAQRIPHRHFGSWTSRTMVLGHARTSGDSSCGL